MATKAQLESKIARLEAVIDDLTDTKGVLFHDDRLIAHKKAKAIRNETPAQSHAANQGKP